MPGQPAYPIIGRAEELTLLRSAIHDAAAGSGQAILIEGEAGIGKTRLLEEAFDYAASTGLTVLRGIADELERERPFAAVTNALDLKPGSTNEQRAVLGRLIAGEAASPGRFANSGDGTLRIMESITTLVEDLTAESPVVLALEDLQWADDFSIRTLRWIGRRLAALPIAVFLTFRPTPREPHLDRLIDEALGYGHRLLALESLTDEDAAQLVCRMLSAHALGPKLHAQVARAAGNPLFVIELIGSLRDEQMLAIESERAETQETAVPASLRETLLRRLSVLSKDAFELLRVASILGSAFPARELSIVTGRSPVDLAAPLSEATRSGFITERQDQLGFRHDLIRETLYADLPGSMRKELHRHAGECLLAAGAPVIRVAAHVFIGAAPGDRDAIRWLHEAGKKAIATSAPDAVSLLRRAFDLTRPASDDRQEVTPDLVLALFNAGRLREAEPLLREALAREADVSRRVALRRDLALLTFFLGQPAAGVDLCEQNANEPSSPPEERLTDLAMVAVGASGIGELDRAERVGAEAMTEAEQTGNNLALLHSLEALATVRVLRGDVEEAVSLSERAVEAHAKVEAAEFVRPNATLDPHYILGYCYLMADRLADAEDALIEGRQTREERGDTWQAALNSMLLSAKRFMEGDWDGAIVDAGSCMSLAADTEIDFIVGILPRSLLATIAVQRGDPQRADALLLEAEGQFERTGPQQGVDWMMWARALAVEAQGDVLGAAARLGALWNLYRMAGYLLAHRWIAPDLVRLSMAVGDEEQARSVTEEMEQLAARTSAATANGAALRCRGLVEGDPALLMQSVEAYRAGPWPVDLAVACEDAATALARTGRTDEAIRLFEEGIETYDRVAAVRLAARGEASLRALGVRRRRRAFVRRPPNGWESLTETERQVARLVAEGLTNRQIGERLFISHRTVETHVGNSFRKLGVSTRAQLAATVAKHEH